MAYCKTCGGPIDSPRAVVCPTCGAPLGQTPSGVVELWTAGTIGDRMTGARRFYGKLT